ncbi:hypothetical protein WNY37_12935 [Henriciella sp. AS95]|uniref:hypothetical protein n=1 Tax=Henriciella sp. AS95 TaxID=3135782 RepID=UPI0031813B0B
MKRAAIPALIITSLALSPSASALTLMDIFGKWNCSVQINDNTGEGQHTQFYGFGGASWRDGEMEMILDNGVVANISYKLVATITVDGDLITESDYKFSRAEGFINGVSSDEMAQAIKDGLVNGPPTEARILHVDDRTLITSADNELTSCTKVD